MSRQTPLPPNAPRLTGVSALARETGYTPPHVSRSLKEGKTADQIREMAKRRDEKRAGSTPAELVNRRRGRVVPQTAEQIVPKQYVPKYRTKNSAAPASTPGKTAAAPIPTVDSYLPFEPDGPGEAVGEDTGETFLEAQRRKEIALADERELRVAVMKKDLVSMAAVVDWFSKIVARAKDVALKVGPENQDWLAAQSDPVKCAERVTEGNKAMLRELGKYAEEML